MDEYSNTDITSAQSSIPTKRILTYSEVESSFMKVLLQTNTAQLQTNGGDVTTGENQVLENPYQTTTLIKEEINELFDILGQISLSLDDQILMGNLVASLDTQIQKLWDLRKLREREFSKFIMLIQPIVKNNEIELAKLGKLDALIEVMQIFKRPKIVDLDVLNCRKKLRKAGLDLLRPLITKCKYKIVIQEES